jgi:hypothetical protein
MMDDLLATFGPWAVIGVAGTGGLLVLLDNRRLLAIVLAAQYALAGWLAAESLGVGVAASQVLGGILTAAIVWVTWRATDPDMGNHDGDLMSRTAFRWVAVLLVLFAAWGLGRRGWMGLPGLTSTANLGATFLMLLGLLQASLFRQPMRVVVGLLTVLSGFGIAYGVVEASLAVIALLIIVHLGLALAGSYLTIIQGTDREGRGPA